MINIGKLKEKDDKIISILGIYLVERVKEIEIQRHAIANLSTLSPSQIMDKIPLLISITKNTINQNRIIIDIDSLIDKINNANSIDEYSKCNRNT